MRSANSKSGINVTCKRMFDTGDPTKQSLRWAKKPAAMSFHIPLFQDLSEEESSILTPLLQVFSCTPETNLFEQGEEAIHFYLILSGNVAIHYKPYDGVSIKLTQLGNGDLCGWSALIGNKFYTSSCISITNVNAVKINGKDLWKFVQEHPDTGLIVIERFAQVVSSRWKNSADEVRAILNHIMKKTNKK